MQIGKLFFPGFFWISFNVIIMPAVLGQALTSKLAPITYPFIRHDLNRFTNEETGLKHFYTQLEKLESRQRRTVNIVHIGDSHLQADFFSGMFRQLMHKRFGTAGRGLVFPFKLARTNSPVDIKAYSNTRWEIKRNVSPSLPLPIGISGITLRTSDPDFMLKLSLGSNGQHLDYNFNKVTIFSEKGPDSYDFILSQSDEFTNKDVLKPKYQYEDVYHKVEVGDVLMQLAAKYGVSVSQIQMWNGLKDSKIVVGRKLIVKRTIIGKENPQSQPEFFDLAKIDNSYKGSSSYSTTVFLDRPQMSVFLRGNKTAEEQKHATFYGIVLENDMRSGILYHMIGVNGAMFRHYNAAPEFFPQVRDLNPDLIIISLGTNESSGKTFNNEWFYNHVNRMVSMLRHHAPYADILLMTPSDAYRYRKYQNPNPGKAKDVLLKFAEDQKFSAWNFYDVMGGYGAISQWYGQGLAQPDRLHLTKAGYEVQGQLLYEALIKGYGDFLSHRSE